MLFRLILLVTLLCGAAICRPQATENDDTTTVTSTVTSTTTDEHDHSYHADYSNLNETNTLGEALSQNYNLHSTRQTLLSHLKTHFPQLFQRYLNAEEDLTVLVPNQTVVQEALRLYQQNDIEGVRTLFKNHTLRGSHSFNELKQLTSVQNLGGDTLTVTVTQSPNGDEVIHVCDQITINSRTAHEVHLANGYFLHTE